MPPSQWMTMTFNVLLTVLVAKQEKEIKGIHILKEIKMITICRWYDCLCKNSKSTDKLLEIISV